MSTVPALSPEVQDARSKVFSALSVVVAYSGDADGVALFSQALDYLVSLVRASTIQEAAARCMAQKVNGGPMYQMGCSDCAHAVIGCEECEPPLEDSEGGVG